MPNPQDAAEPDDAPNIYVRVTLRAGAVRMLDTPGLVDFIRAMKTMEDRVPPCLQCPFGAIAWAHECETCSSLRDGGVRVDLLQLAQEQRLVDWVLGLKRVLRMWSGPGLWHEVEGAVVETERGVIEERPVRELAVLVALTERHRDTSGGKRRHEARRDLRRLEMVVKEMQKKHAKELDSGAGIV